MFKNIGKKIKMLAKLLSWTGIIASIILAIILFLTDDTFSLIVGIIVLICGPLISWISSFFMYGFGELIDKACDIERNTRSGNYQQIAQPQQSRDDKLQNLYAKGLITEEEYQNAILKER